MSAGQLAECGMSAPAAESVAENQNHTKARQRFGTPRSSQPTDKLTRDAR